MCNFKPQGCRYGEGRYVIFDIKHHLFCMRQHHPCTIKEGVDPGAGADFGLVWFKLLKDVEGWNELRARRFTGQFPFPKEERWVSSYDWYYINYNLTAFERLPKALRKVPKARCGQQEGWTWMSTTLGLWHRRILPSQQCDNRIHLCIRNGRPSWYCQCKELLASATHPLEDSWTRASWKTSEDYISFQFSFRLNLACFSHKLKWTYTRR